MNQKTIRAIHAIATILLPLVIDLLIEVVQRNSGMGSKG